MSSIRFIVPDPTCIPPGAADRAYMTGIEGVPWQSRSRWDAGQLLVERSVNESGYLFIGWCVPGHGQFVLSTATLMVRPRPYNLPVELARGTLNRVRNQRAVWEMAGLVVSADVDRKIHAATEALVTATTHQQEPERAALAAAESLAFSLDTVARLGQLYTEQALSIRHRNNPKLSTFFAGNLGTYTPTEKGTRVLAESFNAAVVPMCWSRVERNAGVPDWRQSDAQLQWCQASGLKVCGGPLVKLDRLGVPDWLFLWEDDWSQVQHHVQHYVEQVVQRYQGKVHVWHAASGANVKDAIGLSEEQRLRLTVSAIETVRRVDPRTPVIVSFDQPWAEYMSRESLDLAPLHFADALVRADLGLAGIGFELNVGYWPGGTLPRDLLETSLQIDRWATLGLPLVVMLTAPSSPAKDPRAQLPVEVLSDGTPDGLSHASQREFAEKVVLLLLAKHCVQGIIWNQLHDGTPHAFPHGGLFDAEGRPKPVLETIKSIRKGHLV